MSRGCSTEVKLKLLDDPWLEPFRNAIEGRAAYVKRLARQRLAVKSANAVVHDLCKKGLQGRDFRTKQQMRWYMNYIKMAYKAET